MTATLAYAPGIGWRPYAGHAVLRGAQGAAVRVVLVDVGDCALPVDEAHSFVLRAARGVLSGEVGTA